MMLGTGLFQALPDSTQCNESGHHDSGARIKKPLLSHLHLYKLVRLQKVCELLRIKVCCKLKNTIPALLMIFKNIILPETAKIRGLR